MVSPEQELLLEEATDILLRLHETPEDAAAYWAKSAFLKRGAAERAAYAMAERAWSATAPRARPRRRIRMALAAAAVVLVTLLAGPELRLSWLADHRTTTEMSEVTLPSGDRVALAAETALADSTDLARRRIDLLHGAAFFDVETDGRTFEVSAGDLAIEVLGTAFEVARDGEGAHVAVAEGRVAVSNRGQVWELTEGERLRYSATGEIVRETIDLDRIAAWRQGRLVADDMPLDEFSATLDRYLPGRVLVIGSDLAEARITGSYNLSDPLSALRSAAATTGARVIATPLALTLLIPDR